MRPLTTLSTARKDDQLHREFENVLGFMAAKLLGFGQLVARGRL